jgi:hypothetical protein
MAFIFQVAFTANITSQIIKLFATDLYDGSGYDEQTTHFFNLYFAAIICNLTFFSVNNIIHTLIMLKYWNISKKLENFYCKNYLTD